MKILFPSHKFDKIEDINVEFLKEHGIEALIIDIDNTLVPWKEEPEESVAQWVKKIKENQIKICLLSNNSGKRAKYLADKLELPVFYRAVKPLPFGFKKALKFLNVDLTKVAVIGDQLFTDVLGGNGVKLHTIFIKPRSLNDGVWIKAKRPLENFILSKYDKWRYIDNAK